MSLALAWSTLKVRTACRLSPASADRIESRDIRLLVSPPPEVEKEHGELVCKCIMGL